MLILVSRAAEFLHDFDVHVTAFKQDQDGTQFHPDPAARKLTTNLYDIHHCCEYSDTRRWTEELSETCRVSFQNKFEKLVHLVDFIVRNIYMIFNTISPHDSGVPDMFCVYLSVCEYEIPW
jgi:hypothetical protein